MLLAVVVRAGKGAGGCENIFLSSFVEVLRNTHELSCMPRVQKDDGASVRQYGID
jgi:hypothetical protein